MGSSIALVVTCTHRKCAQPDASLLLRNVPDTELATRAHAWLNRLESSESHYELTELYQGEAWSRARRLLQTAQNLDLEAEMFVASAGLGLRPATAVAPAYGATFSPGHPDSAAQTAAGMRAWWDQVQQHPETVRLNDIDADRVLLVLSSAYAAALHDDLLKLAQARSDVLLVGGHSAVSGVTQLPVSLKLRGELGGTAGSLNLRAAERWLRLLIEHGLNDEAAFRAWQDWQSSIPAPRSLSRSPQSDEEVIAFILDALQRETGLTKSRALRELRDDGSACEQHRFGRLFSAVVAGTRP